jgi:hypothetical protein
MTARFASLPIYRNDVAHQACASILSVFGHACKKFEGIALKRAIALRDGAAFLLLPVWIVTRFCRSRSGN